MAKNQNNNVAPATQKTDPGAKKDALATALAQIEKQFGKGAVMKLGDNAAMQVDAISTGSIGLDLALGVGGVPRGRIIEVYGPESSGKTTLALHVLAEAQKKGGDVAFIDVEHALDPVYAEALGVDINNLLVSQPDTGEQAMEICEALVRSGAIDAIVVDSVAAMVPRAEIEGEMGDSHVGLQARLMSQAMRKLTSVIGKTNTVCIFINQLREKVGVVYGNPEVTTGGRALKYYSSVRIDIRSGHRRESRIVHDLMRLADLVAHLLFPDQQNIFISYLCRQRSRNTARSGSNNCYICSLHFSLHLKIIVLNLIVYNLYVFYHTGRYHHLSSKKEP